MQVQRCLLEVAQAPDLLDQVDRGRKRQAERQSLFADLHTYVNVLEPGVERVRLEFPRLVDFHPEAPEPALAELGIGGQIHTADPRPGAVFGIGQMVAGDTVEVTEDQPAEGKIGGRRLFRWRLLILERRSFGLPRLQRLLYRG